MFYFACNYGKMQAERREENLIDFKRAQGAFEEYLEGYDRKDDKIRLKIVHTYCVVDCAEDIALRMGLCREDVELAKIIGLLHDIGRFEQVRLFDSFQPDTMDHAAYGAELLFGEKRMIRRFLDDDVFDGIVRTAIAKHSNFALEGVPDRRTLLHARLIRDADKLDNCRVKIEEDIETLLGVSPEEAGEGFISPKVWQACLERKSVLSADRVTKVDYWASYLAQYFDVNFRAAFDIIREHNYLPAIRDRLVYREEDTRNKMDILVKMVEEYMEML